MLASNNNPAACGARSGTRGIDIAAHRYSTPLAGVENHAAVSIYKAWCLNFAQLGNHTLQNGVCTARRQDHHAAFGSNEVLVLDERVDDRLGNCHRDQLRPLQGQANASATGQCSSALPCNYNPFISDFGCQQCNVPAKLRLQISLVDDRAFRIGTEVELTLLEVAVADVVDRNDKTPDVDLCAGAKDHSAGIA